MEQKKTTEDETEPATNAGNQAAKKQYPLWWQRFKSWARESSSFTDWCIAFFTLVLTVVAVGQFRVADRQLDVMRKDLRAWVKAEMKDGVAIGVDAIPFASITVSNTGKTPASHVVEQIYVEIVLDGQDPKFGAQIPHTITFSGAIFPNVPHETIAARVRPKIGGNPAESENAPFTKEEVGSLTDGKSWLAVYGDVEYEDTFHVSHWIHFCFWNWVRPGNYRAAGCTAYNSVDDNR